MPATSVRRWRVGSRMTWVTRLSRLNVRYRHRRWPPTWRPRNTHSSMRMKFVSVETWDDRSAAQSSCCSPIAVTNACSAISLTTIPEMPTSANLLGLRRVRKRRRTRGRRCQRVALWAFGSGCVTDPSVRTGVGRIVIEPRMERQTADAQKRPKEPIGPPVRFRRCKHLRLGSAVPRSVAAAADASTCDVAFGPSWPLRAKQRYGRPSSFWLWAYPRTSRAGTAIPSALSTVRPRTR